jgi:integrase
LPSPPVSCSIRLPSDYDPHNHSTLSTRQAQAGTLSLTGGNCHGLRQSGAATWAQAGGAKIDALADMLGHSSTDTTRVYARIVDKMTENPARFLEAMLTA